MTLYVFKKIGRVIFPIFFICFSYQSFAQKQELGLGLGASAYSGEIVQHLDVRNFRPAGQIYYRINFSDVVSLRVAASTGVLAASDKIYSNAMSANRQAFFNGNYSDVNVMLEYNFLNYGYKNEQDRGKFSPYLAGGFGFFGYSNGVSDPSHSTNSSFLPVVPFGGGFKYRINAHLSFNYQFIANKTFTTNIDGIYTPPNSPHSYTTSNSPDWYYYTGVSIGYIFWKVHCPKR